LGLRESGDPALRTRGAAFVNDWLQRNGNRIYFDNQSSPLRDADGTCVVWLGGYGVRDGWLLNVELIRAGLAELDLAPWDGYRFTVATKRDGEVAVDWRRGLTEALARRRLQ
jgi:hypothetical protein